ncbi:SAV_6107 family HEPN domain-containing protein [Dietzia sp. UBA5065]|uniref:SAV_6107 family HEPN domain-containing protein n=1 Tax=Dietzia sp. UBA5065 TaxID=1946422 RepID=UPI0025C56EDE|nr:SAV_6107 family HEPN domain-containing protein [Dietzia sp. UBA5065]HMT49880.1 SAV_6107 family HEPN domain-containing protein [Dietzia sp.]
MTVKVDGRGPGGGALGSLSRAGRAEVLRGRAVAAHSPAERFLEAYRAARTAASALLAPGPRRRGPSDVWHRLAAEVPEMGEWAAAFGGYSTLAAAVEDGLPRTVTARMADDFLWAVGRFLDLVDERLGVLGPAA